MKRYYKANQKLLGIFFSLFLTFFYVSKTYATVIEFSGLDSSATSGSIENNSYAYFSYLNGDMITYFYSSSGGTLWNIGLAGFYLDKWYDEAIDVSRVSSAKFYFDGFFTENNELSSGYLIDVFDFDSPDVPYINIYADYIFNIDKTLLGTANYDGSIMNACVDVTQAFINDVNENRYYSYFTLDHNSEYFFNYYQYLSNVKGQFTSPRLEVTYRDSVNNVPEPSSMLLLILGGILSFLYRKIR